MKIVQIGFHDTAGSGFFLAHALNKHTKHTAVNIRFIDDYPRFPAMIEAGDYTKDQIRNMLYKADIVHFHINVKPFFTSLRLDPARFKDKKTLIYYHGSFLRMHGKQLVNQAKEVLPDSIITVSTPDLLDYVKDAVWLPVCRPFKELQDRFLMSKADLKACKAFGRKHLLTFVHPTTSVKKKKSHIFFRALTNVVRGNKNVRGKTIINSSWDACMRKVARFDVLLASAGPVGGYGCVAVEAAAFSLPVVSWMTPRVYELFKKVAGEVPPVVSWKDPADLEERLFTLAERTEVRRLLGGQIHDFMRKFHDEKPVAERYMKIISGR